MRNKNRILILLLIAAILVCAAAPRMAQAESPSLSFGAESLRKGQQIFLGRDEGHSSLRWRILDVDSRRALLITKDAISVRSMYGSEYEFMFAEPEQLYDENYYPIAIDSWDKGNIRVLCDNLARLWKGKPPYNIEFRSLLPCTVEETENYRAGRFDLPFLPSSLKDEVFFLLSAKEAEQYFDGETDRVCRTAGGAPTWWWLRSRVLHNSPYIDQPYIYGVVDDAGWLNSLDVSMDYGNPFAGFRPSCQLLLQRVLFTTAEGAGKAKLSGEASMNPIAAGDYDTWKLTLLEDRKFQADAAPLSAAPGGSMAISYANALKGTKDAISAIICSREGTPLYYGSVRVRQAEGVAEFPVPPDIAPGEYVVRVFNETRYDDRNSDLASPMTDIPLTVR